MSEVPEVLVGVSAGVGRITLNRPQAINALTHSMVLTVQDALDRWSDEERVRRVELAGAGQRGFCAGADVRMLREQVLDDPDSVLPFFDDEYRLDATLAHYPKPVTAHMDGITMGGGLGLSLHVPHRVGGHSTRLAMPEVIIGFFPDVGALFPISRMPGCTGTWWAMTGASLDQASALWAGLLSQTDELEVLPEDSWLARARAWIDECFDGDDPARIVERLADHSDPEARTAANLVRSRSPLSVAVTLEGLQRASQMSTVDEVLAQDALLVRRFLPRSDFLEGVRAQVVDKDRRPHWRHGSLDEVSRDEVLSFFEQ